MKRILRAKFRFANSIIAQVGFASWTPSDVLSPTQKASAGLDLNWRFSSRRKPANVKAAKPECPWKVEQLGWRPCFLPEKRGMASRAYGSRANFLGGSHPSPSTKECSGAPGMLRMLQECSQNGPGMLAGHSSSFSTRRDLLPSSPRRWLGCENKSFNHKAAPIFSTRRS
jgi:hypothetical protein